MDSDRAKDSNMNCTVMSRVLDLVREKNPPEYALPRGLIVAADNTAREGKNQYVANFLSYLTTQEKFETVQEEFFRVGHTHNEQDQRFSSVATILSRARTLESPEDFSGANSGQ